MLIFSFLSIPIVMGINGGYFSEICRVCFSLEIWSHDNRHRLLMKHKGFDNLISKPIRDFLLLLSFCVVLARSMVIDSARSLLMRKFIMVWVNDWCLSLTWRYSISKIFQLFAIFFVTVSLSLIKRQINFSSLIKVDFPIQLFQFIANDFCSLFVV